MDFDEWTSGIARCLAGPLPGPAGQLPMAPRPRFGWKPGEIPDDCRHSAALLLLYPRAGEPHLLLTVRNSDLPNHAGQVSLPGGAVEAGESLDRTALREAREEVGIDPDTVRILGGLSPLHVPVSKFVIHPRVAGTPAAPCLEPDRREVSRVLEVSLGSLSAPETLAVETRSFDGHEVQVPFFRVEGEKVWGATAMVLCEFLGLRGRPPDPWRED